ncbi:MAG: apolipoprotein N-acyltransferase, partial [Aestuariivirga sp.]
MIQKLNRFWYSLALVAVGAAGALAMPPYGQWWILGPVFSFFVYAEAERNSQSSLSRFVSGWLFGLGYFLAVLQWISNAFFVDAQHDLWMMPFAVGGLSALLAVFWGAANVGAFHLKRFDVSELWSLPLSLGLAEFARGHVLTGFPWAVPGLAVDGMGGVAQAASLIGMNGLTFLVLAWAVAPAVFILKLRRSYVEAVVVLFLLPVLWVWGDSREAGTIQEFVPGVTLRLVQPNIPQNEKWREGNAPKIWNKLLSLTKQAPANNGPAPTHVIWPESSVPFLLDESSEAKDDLQGALGGSKILLAGAVRRQRDSTSGREDYFTSVELYDSGANLVGKYDKWHLVPGGEFLPMAWLLEPLGLRRLVNLPESFAAGSGPQSLQVPGAGVVAPSICYEAIFPDAFSGLSPRPDWFVNVTNDGWFGDSAGPHQHLAQLRLRAIEQGVPIARAANTGISAVIDPVGRYVVRSSINVMDVFDVGLPKAISATVFSRWGFLLQFVLPFLII